MLGAESCQADDAWFCIDGTNDNELDISTGQTLEVPFADSEWISPLLAQTYFVIRDLG